MNCLEVVELHERAPPRVLTASLQLVMRSSYVNAPSGIAFNRIV